MSIQRYIATLGAVQGNENGAYVLYADHVQAMEAEAESAHDLGVIYGINHERARIRQALSEYTVDPYGLRENGGMYLDGGAILSIINGESNV